MQNICFFNTTSFLGGGEKKHLSYALRFVDKGNHVLIITSDDAALQKKALEHGIPVETVSLSNLSWLDPFKIKKLSNMFSRHAIDTVIFNGPRDMKAGSIAAKRAGVKHIVYWRGIALPPQNSFLNRYLMKHVLTHIITNSGMTKKMFLKKLQGVPPDKVKVVYNGVDVNMYHRTGKKSDGTAMVIGNAARLTKQKGQAYLVELAALMKAHRMQANIIIAGEGERKRELQAMIAQKGVEDMVEMRGFVDDMRSFLQTIDVLVFPSLWEGFGFAMVEAMACGKPVIAFDVSSNPEIVAHGKTGYLVKAKDVQALYEHVRRLYEDPGLYAEMADNARKHVQERFDVHDRFEQFAKTIES